MIDTSEEFVESLSGDVQIVRPSVNAWMSDLRMLDNLDVYTSSHTLPKQITDRNPSVYVKFDKTDFDAIASGANYYDTVKDYGSLKFNFGYANNALSPTVNINIESHPITENAIEFVEPKYLMHTFYNAYDPSLGYFTDPTDSDPELRYYSFNNSVGTSWYAATGKGFWAGGGPQFDSIPVYVYLNMRCLDHFVDFKIGGTTNIGGLGAIVRYVDDDNYIYCRTTRTAVTTDSIAIYKVINGTHIKFAAINNTHFSTSNYYRFEAKYNTFTVYDLGALGSVPSQSTTGTSLLSCYIDDPIFRSSDATNVGLLNAGVFTYNPTYTNGTTFSFDYFGSYGYNYLVGAHKFAEDKAVIANVSTFLNQSSQYDAITSLSDFTLSFLLKKTATGSEAAQTIFWLGSSTPTTSVRVAYITSTGKLQIKMVDTSNNVYTVNSTATISNNTLYNIQIVKSGSDINLWINGSLDATLDTGSSFALKASASLITFGGDLAGTSLGDSNTKHLLNGMISEFAIFDYAFIESDAISFYKSIQNAGTLYAATVDDYCNAECIVDGILEQSLPFSFTNQLSSSGQYQTVDGKYFLVESEENVMLSDNVEDNYGWMSRVESGSNGSFSNPDFVEIRFDSAPCNKIFLSTSYYGGRIDDFSYVIEKAAGGTISGSTSFGGESVKTIELDDTYNIISVKITPTSTVNGYDYARLFTINPIWDVDLSDYVVSFSIDKVRENLDSSLPIGATAANNGSIVLDNTSQVFNIFGDTLYGKYTVPDTRFFFSFTHELLDYGTEETIPVSYDIYADTWSFDNSSMTVEVSIRDYSKYLQEKTLAGYINQGVIAGRGIAEILMTSGFPARKINYIQRFEDAIFEDSPYVYIPFNQSVEDIEDSVIPTSTVAFLSDADQCNIVDLRNSYYPHIAVGGNIVFSESLSSDADIRRQDDLGYIQTFESSYINRSMRTEDYWDLLLWSDPSATPFDFFSNEADEWTVEMLYYSPTTQFEPPGYNRILFDGWVYPGHSAFELSFAINGSQIQFRWGFANTSDVYTYMYSEWLPRDQIYHVVVRKTVAATNEYDLFINGYLAATMSSSSSYSTTNSKEVKITRGYMSHVTFYQHPLSDARIESHYISSAVSNLPVYRYLYGAQETYWDAMLSIATADLGMFYFDEYGNFQYEYRDTFHQNYITRYQNSQYTFSDDTNILGGSYVNEIQTNKVSVSVYNTSLAAYQYDSIWSAPSNESLALTTITENLFINSSSIKLATTTSPQWPDSGYLKIDDEIIKYSYISGNSLGGIERGVFNTKPAYHLSGAKAREVRYYEATYSSVPAASVKYPLITNDNVDIDFYVSNAYRTEVLVSLNSSLAIPAGEQGTVEILNGRSPIEEIDQFFSIAGIPLSFDSSKESITSMSADIRENIRRYGIKELTIDNKFIQNKRYANIVANHIISYYKNPVRNMSLNILAVPTLQLGDLITVEKFDDLGLQDEMFWVIGSNISYDGTLNQSLSLLAYASPAAPPEFTFGSASAGTDFSGGEYYIEFYQ